MTTQLTNRGIHKIFNDELDVEIPVFQVLATKRINSGNNDHFRAKFSDGTKFSADFVLGAQLNFIAEKITPYSVILVNRYVCKSINENRKVAIILDLDVLHRGKEGDAIGNPTQYIQPLQQGATSDGNLSNNFQNTSVVNTSSNQFYQPHTNTDLIRNPTQYETSFQQEASSCGIASNNFQNPTQYETSFQQQASTSTASNYFPNASLETSSSYSEQIHIKNFDRGSLSAIKGSSSVGKSPSVSRGVLPITSLNPYIKNWRICVRVTTKSDIRHYNNSRGEGEYFFMHLSDESGEIRAVAFNEVCNKFYNNIEISKVYYISGAILKKSNKLYNKLDHNYEMTFNRDTQVTLCHDTNIPEIFFHFVGIDEIENIDGDAFIGNGINVV